MHNFKVHKWRQRKISTNQMMCEATDSKKLLPQTPTDTQTQTPSSFCLATESHSLRRPLTQFRRAGHYAVIRTTYTSVEAHRGMRDAFTSKQHSVWKLRRHGNHRLRVCHETLAWPSPTCSPRSCFRAHMPSLLFLVHLSSHPSLPEPQT